MVEGPGCTLNGGKFRRLRCTKLAKVSFAGGEKSNSRNASSGKNSNDVNKNFGPSAMTDKIKSFEGMTLIGAESLGKELFVYFDGASLCLRLHFGMDGSVYVNSLVSMVECSEIR